MCDRKGRRPPVCGPPRAEVVDAGSPASGCRLPGECTYVRIASPGTEADPRSLASADSARQELGLTLVSVRPVIVATAILRLT